MTKRNSTDAIASKQTKKHSTKRLTTADFIRKAKVVHAEHNYDYSKVDYVNGRAKVEIICPKHGSFFQAAGSHLHGRKCKQCGIESRVLGRTYSTDDFIRLSNEAHNNKFNYDKLVYTKSQHKVVITCPLHGDFKQIAAVHLLGHGCPDCSGVAKLNSDVFIARANAKHGSRYCYNKVDYNLIKSKVIIGCDSHGDFEQIAADHLNGSHCPHCSSEASGWGLTKFIGHCSKNADGSGILYVIKCFNDNECFYKIGVTSKSIGIRFGSKTLMPYEYSVCYELSGSPEFVFGAERSLHRLLAKYSYQPLIYFGGITECFTTIEPVEKLLKRLSSTEQLQLIA